LDVEQKNKSTAHGDRQKREDKLIIMKGTALIIQRESPTFGEEANSSIFSVEFATS
jgi:hypothetical protein